MPVNEGAIYSSTRIAQNRTADKFINGAVNLAREPFQVDW